MPDETGFALRRITPTRSDVDPAEAEESALQLRQDLLASGVAPVERIATGPAPEAPLERTPFLAGSVRWRRRIGAGPGAAGRQCRRNCWAAELLQS
jgi:hypothetical protein